MLLHTIDITKYCIFADSCRVDYFRKPTMYFLKFFVYLIIHFSNFHVVLISEEPSKPSMLSCASPIIQLFKFRNKSDI